MSIVSRRDASSANRGERCPLCGKPSAAPVGPFCSQGCRDRDLLNWLGDGYRVPGEPVALDGEDALDSGR